MGVRGLSTFIKERREKFLTRHQLCNEVVVIDGDNLIHYINARSKGLNLAFGGDYHKYSVKVESFFNDLKRCGITPIVLLDGGSDPSNRKLKTAFTRLTSKLDSTKKLAPATQHRHSCLPLLSKTAFVEVLSRLGLPYAVCPFEADEPLAALARRLNCSVISDDTDFFAFGVRCVPLGSLADEPELRMDGQMAIDCLLFRHDRFMQEYGLRPQLMPLLACLLGNDYISPGSLRAFFRHVPRPYGERRGRPSGLRIKGALAWLRRHTDPEEALQEVLSRIRKEERQHVGRLVRRLMDNYTGLGWPEDLLGQLALPQEVLDSMDMLPPIDQCGNQLAASEPGDRIATMPLDDTDTDTEAPARTPDDAVDANDVDVAHDDASNDASDDDPDDGLDDSADDGCDDATADASGDDALGNDALDNDIPLPTANGAVEAAADGRLLLDGAPLPEWLAESLRRGRFTADVINLISGQPLLEEPQVEDPRQPPSCVCVEPLLRWMSWCLHSQPDLPLTTYRRADSGRSVVRGKLVGPIAGTPPPPLLSAVPEMTQVERRRAVLMALEAGSDGVAELEAVLEELPPRLRVLALALRYWRRAAGAGVSAAHLGALLLPERRASPGVIPLAAPDAALLSGAASFERRLAHQLAQLQCVLAQTNNVNALMASPLEPVSPARAFAGPLVYNAITQLRAGGLEKAEQWLSGQELDEWNRELRLLCRATGVDPELKPTPVPAHVRKRDSTRPTPNPATTAVAGVTRQAGDEEEGSKRKVMRKTRPQPQLTGNKFAALLQGSDDDDETSSDDS